MLRAQSTGSVKFLDLEKFRGRHYGC